MRNIVGFHRQCVCPVPAEAEELVPFLYSDFSTVFRYEQLPEHGRQRKVGDREPKWGRDHRDPDADSKRRRHDGVSIRVSAVGSARHSLWRMVKQSWGGLPSLGNIRSPHRPQSVALPSIAPADTSRYARHLKNCCTFERRHNLS